MFKKLTASDSSKQEQKSGAKEHNTEPPPLDEKYPDWVAYQPDLIPPLPLMRKEGITVLEEWFRWAEEWSFLLRLYGKIQMSSRVLEIGCGLGRTAFPLRYILLNGKYEGFEICKYKVDFLQEHFTPAHSNFRFIWADIHNTYYNPEGKIAAEDYEFPYSPAMFDIVYAASVFTHMLPSITQNYFKQTARVLKKDGRAVFSFFVLDHYRPGEARPLGFSRAGFNFDHEYLEYGNEFKISNPENPEEMTAYKKALIEKYAAEAGLELVLEPVAGLWSGSFSTWIGAQDIVVLRKR
jgi:SAM-dependent methyltransferase